MNWKYIAGAQLGVLLLTIAVAGFELNRPKPSLLILGKNRYSLGLPSKKADEPDTVWLSVIKESGSNSSPANTAVESKFYPRVEKREDTWVITFDYNQA